MSLIDRDRDVSEMPIARASPPRPQSAPQLNYRTHHAVGRTPGKGGGSSGAHSPAGPVANGYLYLFVYSGCILLRLSVPNDIAQ
jgi:hypothetical protein